MRLVVISSRTVNNNVSQSSYAQGSRPGELSNNDKNTCQGCGKEYDNDDDIAKQDGQM